MLNTSASCGPAWTGLEQISHKEKATVRVNKITFLTKWAIILCMVTEHFMTHSVYVENLCPPWSFGFICTINASFTILFPDPWVDIWHCLGLYFPLNFPWGSLPVWPYWLMVTLPVTNLTSVCVASFMAHRTLGTFPNTFILFPFVFCSLSKREVWTHFLTLFDFAW